VVLKVHTTSFQTGFITFVGNILRDIILTLLVWSFTRILHAGIKVRQKPTEVFFEEPAKMMYISGNRGGGARDLTEA